MEKIAERFEPCFLALHAVTRKFEERRTRRQLLEERIRGRDDDRRPGLAEVIKARQPLGHDLARRRNAAKGIHVPSGKPVNAALERRATLVLAQEELQVPEPTFRFPPRGRDDHRGASGLSQAARQVIRSRSAAQPEEAQSPARGPTIPLEDLQHVGNRSRLEHVRRGKKDS